MGVAEGKSKVESKATVLIVDGGSRRNLCRNTKPGPRFSLAMAFGCSSTQGGHWERMSFFPHLQSDGTDRRGTGRSKNHKLTFWPKYLLVEDVGA